MDLLVLNGARLSAQMFALTWTTETSVAAPIDRIRRDILHTDLTTVCKSNKTRVIHRFVTCVHF